MGNDNRVNEDSLEYDDDMRMYNGTPFTGVGYETYENGNLKSETTYLNGFQNGISKEFYPDGNLKSEHILRNCEPFSHSTYWHSNRVMKSNAQYEWGIEIEYKEWTDRGELVINRKLDDSSSDSQYGLLEKFRKVYGENRNVI